MRGTTAASESFSTKCSGEPPLKPDPENPQRQTQIKRAQQILGTLLWLSTRSRPDLSYAVSMAASVQTRDLRELEVRLRHLLQYVSSHPHLGLHFPYPTSTYLSLEAFIELTLRLPPAARVRIRVLQFSSKLVILSTFCIETVLSRNWSLNHLPKRSS